MPEILPEPPGAPPESASAVPSSRWTSSRLFLEEHWASIDTVLFVIFAGAWILAAAGAFYKSLHAQTGGEWSAPLDDVFIHFDYARATARGFPFQWSEGNGFSSGNTSVLYPFVLALGYWLGFQGLELMHWAAWVACMSMLAFFLSAKALLEPLGRWAKYLLPPVVLSIGAFNWSLWSGMENALHLGVWGLMLRATLPLCNTDSGEAKKTSIASHALLSGAAGALLYLTRPESVVCIAAFAVFAALSVRKSHGLRKAALALFCIAFPGALTLALHSIANRVFTGEWSSAGAITKLAINHPYMTGTQKWDDYLSHIHYVVLRLCQHHFSDVLPFGYLVPATALIGLFDRRIRAHVVLLLSQTIAWLAMVSLNGQVRWQNERYTMSAVAWLLTASALGLAALMSRPGHTVRARVAWLARTAAAVLAMGLFYYFHQPNMRDQQWFFGRACRNIRDQHVVAGRLLASLKPRRVLVGDAGALTYIADRPGLDLIGLGGYHDFPFARANTHGLGATIELIERIPEADRPDYMAIYPSWWGDFPGIFGRRATQIPVVGNVICGGAEKVIYRAFWTSLDRSGRPRSLKPAESVKDELDVADLISEREHSYEFPHPSMGFVVYRVLSDPGNPAKDLFDAGRIVPGGQREKAILQAPSGPGRLIVRTLAGESRSLEVWAGGNKIGTINVGQESGWIEKSIELPAGLASPMTLELSRPSGDFVIYHLWITETRADLAQHAF